MVKLYYLASFSCDAGVIWLHGQRLKSFKGWDEVHCKSTILRECWVNCSVMDWGERTLWRIRKGLCRGEHSLSLHQLWRRRNNSDHADIKISGWSGRTSIDQEVYTEPKAGFVLMERKRVIKMNLWFHLKKLVLNINRKWAIDYVLTFHAIKGLKVTQTYLWNMLIHLSGIYVGERYYIHISSTLKAMYQG